MTIKAIIATFVLAASATFSFAQKTAVDTWGTTPDLHIEGNHLVDANGMNVMLHGIMDTPSPYFSGYRFTDNHWIDVYKDGDKYISKCITYFNKLFTAATDTTQGSWCNVFRLHLDPCWTDNPNVKASGFTESNGKVKDPNGNEVSGESNIRNFDKNRLTKYLSSLYVPIAKKAQGHGMYVIMRPPGVCPNTIKVGDYYQKYLITVWDIVTKNADVLDNSGWLSIELANEPINIRDANGNQSSTAMRDFFQPIVDKIRENGFKGIIWVPGGTWQQDYKSYASYPVKDDKFGYAVHWYPGWYSTSDKSYNETNSLNSFLSSVPVAKTHPIMITEVDWSPEDPTQPSKKNEWGEEVRGNYGTWGTGSTSKFGKAYKYVIDYLGNCGMTLTHTHDYMDIDYYISTGKLRPAFSTKLSNVMEACSGACFEWYKNYAHTVHEAKEWDVTGDFYFDDANSITLASSALDGKTIAVTDASGNNFFYVNDGLDSPQNVRTASMDNWGAQNYKFFKFKKVLLPGLSIGGDLYTIQLANETGANYNLWGNGGYLNTPPGGWCLFALGLDGGNKYKYGQDGDYFGLWKVEYEEGNGYLIRNVGRMLANAGAYLTPASETPVGSKEYVRFYTKASKRQPSAIEDIAAGKTEATVVAIYDLNGRRLPGLQKGLNIIKMSDGSARKVMK